MTTKTATPGKTIRIGKGQDGTTYRLRFIEGESGAMGLYIGTGKWTTCVGHVADADNFEYAVQMADEESAALREQARIEFGY